MSLRFVIAKKKEDFKEIYDYTTDAFSDTPDFTWDIDGIKAEVKNGWQLESVYNKENDVVAALFYKIDDDHKTLLTKNSGLRINHQGLGYSHQIKKYFDQLAKEKGMKKIAHFCRIDNFRAYSLNESHAYKKTKNITNDGLVVEWLKNIK